MSISQKEEEAMSKKKMIPVVLLAEFTHRKNEYSIMRKGDLFI